MNPFDTAWDIVKAWGEGFRVHGYDLSAPSVTELVPIYGGTGKKDQWDEWATGNLNPMRVFHDMTPGRGSGTGVSGTYYHAGPWDPLQSSRNRPDLDKLLRWLEADKNQDNNMVYIPPPQNPIATTPRMRDMSMQLLRNVLTENQRDGYGAMTQERGSLNGVPQPPHEYFEQPATPGQTYRQGTYNTAPARFALPRTLKDSIDLIASPYTKERGTYWSNVEDLVGGETNNSLGGKTLGRYGNRLFDYLGKTPLVQRIMGNDIGYHWDDEYNWMNDPEVLQALGERMQDTGGLSPMNILLGEMGHDAVVPVLQSARGHPGMIREIREGSVLLPPTTDNWWENYHPMEGGSFEMLQPHHVEGWIDEFDQIQEALSGSDRAKKVAEADW